MDESIKYNYQLAEFAISVAELEQCPSDSIREVAFAGRSNAGKSSALNALTCSRKLARTSKTPGRTQLINFFKLAEARYLVDLPGYGYAKVPEHMKKAWQKNLNLYLEERQPLSGIVLLMDIRHPLKEFDQMIINWSSHSRMPIHILLTKADKIKNNLAKSTLQQIKKELSWLKDLVSVQLFSATKKTGVDMLCIKLNTWLT